MAAYVYEAPVAPRQVMVFSVILGAHVLLAYAFSSGLVRQVVEKVTTTEVVEVKPVDETLPPPPPPADPTLERVLPDEVPPPVVPIDYDEPVTAIYTAPTRTVDPPPVAPPAPEPLVLEGKHRLPSTDDYYPPAAIRGGEEGAANVRVCVDANGKLSGTPRVERTSGFDRLDRGAVELVKDGRFARTMQGGQFVPNCHRFRIHFQLK